MPTISPLPVTITCQFKVVFATNNGSKDITQKRPNQENKTMPMKHFKNAQKQEVASLGIEGINAFLQDTGASDHAAAPIAYGFFRMEAGNPLEYTYSYDECKVILEGEMTIAEVDGESYDVSAGDVVYFSRGTSVVFSSKSSGLGFYCGQRKLCEL